MWEALLQWDRQTFIYLNNLGTEELDTFWVIVTNFYTWIPLFLLFIFLLFFKFKRKEAVIKLISLLLLVVFITLFTHLTKVSVGRLRPNNDETINTLIRILVDSSGFSFFSGHSSSSFSIATLMFLFLRQEWKWAMLFFIWPILFALSRIFVGVHYPLDIIVGSMVGLLTALSFYWLHRKFIAPGLE